MSAQNFINIRSDRSRSHSAGMKPKVLLVKPPYFTPWTPPLGIAILKSFLERNGYLAQCFDFNTDPELWGMHHKYFALLQSLEDVSINDGYSKLWWILNAHMLSHANGANAAQCKKVLETVIPLYGVSFTDDILNNLISLVSKFYKRLGESTDQLDLADYVAVGTSTYTTSLGPSLYFLKQIKEKYPGIKTVMGGGVFADDLASGSDNLKTLVDEFHYIDHVILGEGELTFLKLLEGELPGKRVISIADLNSETLNMSDVPSPDFSDFNLNNYYHLTIEGARSCPFQCSFCSETIQWGDYRKKPADQFVQQVIELSDRHKNNSFFMGDSLMNPYIFQFSSGLLERKANVLYDGYLRADKPVTYRDKVKVWARSGFYRARLGIESASANVLNTMDKMTSPKTISDALKSLANAGIRTTTYWIVGFPQESEDDFQETLEFIREHHRYIYELEAHPYYYYPYGQIGSRLHQCYSLYPEEVIHHTRFKVWEIINANPTREERYERLWRISNLASELRLPNIYTMSERFKAEDRWHRLWPLATEVYKETRVSRDKTRPPRHALKVFSGEWERLEEAGWPEIDFVWCYSARVTKNLNENALRTSVGHLIDYNEMLKMSLKNGEYIPAPDSTPHEDVLFIDDYDEKEGQDLELLKRRTIDHLSAGMRPERNESIRVALLKNREGDNHVLLLVHRAIADSRSVILLFEDLFRIYEQVSNESEISLRPVEKTYEQFIDEVTRIAGQSLMSESLSSGPTIRGEATGTFKVHVNDALTKRIFADFVREYDLKPPEVLAAALLKSLAKSRRTKSIDPYIMHDYRHGMSGLEATAAPLTRARALPDGLFDDQNLLRCLQEVRQAMRQVASKNSLKLNRPSPEHTTLLLKTDYFVEEPWLGGDEWMPEGFIIDENRLRTGFSFEVVPVLSGQTLEIFFNYKEGRHDKELVEEMAQNFIGELDLILRHCEDYCAARRFWLKDFKDYHAEPNFIVGDDEAETDKSGAVLMSYEFDATLLNELRSGCGADLSIITLAAFATCLSRINNREDLLLVTSVGRRGESLNVPLKIRVPWRSSFRELARAVEQKLELAKSHSAYAFEILTDELPTAAQNYQPPVFDVKYTFNEPSRNSRETSAEDSLIVDSQSGRQASLALTASSVDGSLQVQIAYDRNKFSEVIINSLGACLRPVLKNVARQPDVKIGDIELIRDAEDEAALKALASNDFDFI